LSDEHTNAVDDLHYVQIRYPRGDRWITIAREKARHAAARRAALAFPEVVDADGRHAMQVRVIGRAQLGADHGQAALRRAEEDLLQTHRANPVPARTSTSMSARRPC
jgi:hypothetical protein